MYGIHLIGLQLCIVTVYCATFFKTAEKLIFNPVKIDRLPVLYCYSHNRAHQASVDLLLLELFSIQAHVISQNLHFFGRNNFHESVFEALWQRAATIQTSVALLLHFWNFIRNTVQFVCCFSRHILFAFLRFSVWCTEYHKLSDSVSQYLRVGNTEQNR